MIFYAMYLDEPVIPEVKDLEQMDEIEAPSACSAACILVRDVLDSSDVPRAGSEFVLVGSKAAPYNWRIIKATWCTQVRTKELVVAPAPESMNQLTAAAAVAFFDGIITHELKQSCLRAQYAIYNCNKMRPGAGMLAALSFFIDILELRHPVHMWRALLEVDHLIRQAMGFENVCLVKLTAIRRDAIEACRR